MFAEKKEQSLKRQRSRHLSDPQDTQTQSEENHGHGIDPLIRETPGSMRGSLYRASSNSDLDSIVGEVITAKKTCLHVTREKLDKYNLRFDVLFKGDNYLFHLSFLSTDSAVMKSPSV